jgi:hypothetical protein
MKKFFVIGLMKINKIKFININHMFILKSSRPRKHRPQANRWRIFQEPPWPTKSELRCAYYGRNHGFISTGYGNNL